MHPGIQDKQWRRIGTQKRAGVLLGLFSVYSRHSVGVGDFADLRKLIDWAHSVGMSVVQLLPMNEVGGVFCPYDAVSSCALEPMYICLADLPPQLRAGFDRKIQELQERYPVSRPYVDYGIKQEKSRLLREIFDAAHPAVTRPFRDFCARQAYWLDEYCLYKTLKSRFAEQAWYAWPREYRDRDAQALVAFGREHEAEIIFFKWVQWLLYEQFCGVKRYASERDVLLKGDLPILVSRDSHDVWAHPEFFKLEFAAGAPPDMYCARGQRWGMPTYNWNRIADDSYRYIKGKLLYAQNFYDLLRVDHVVGLFRIWSIPFEDDEAHQGLHGVFDPADEAGWGEHGRSLLSLIVSSTHMLVCAEDLGLIPPVCRQVLAELGIPGNEVQRWTKDWEKRHDFLLPAEYRATAVSMLSTHDTTNWPAWWKYEASTIDEALFMRTCQEKGMDYRRIKERLFDERLSRYGRLRWLAGIDSVQKLCVVLEKNADEVKDIIGMYENSYAEKEKLWHMLGCGGPMREAPDAQMVKAAVRITLSCRSAFCIETLIDWLFTGAVYTDDPYLVRINTPGSVSEKNWSQRIPLGLEELATHPVSRTIRSLISSSPAGHTR